MGQICCGMEDTQNIFPFLTFFSFYRWEKRYKTSKMSTHIWENTLTACCSTSWTNIPSYSRCGASDQIRHKDDSRKVLSYKQATSVINCPTTDIHFELTRIGCVSVIVKKNISEKLVKTDLILPALLLTRCSNVSYKFILTRTKIQQLYDCTMYSRRF